MQMNAARRRISDRFIVRFDLGSLHHVFDAPVNTPTDLRLQLRLLFSRIREPGAVRRARLDHFYSGFVLLRQQGRASSGGSLRSQTHADV